MISLFRKKEKVKVGRYVGIMYSDEAINKSLFYECLKLFRHFYNDTVTYEEPYTEAKEKQLREDGMVVVDLTKLQMKQARIRPRNERMLSVLQFGRRL